MENSSIHLLLTHTHYRFYNVLKKGMMTLTKMEETGRSMNQQILEDWISALDALNRQIKQWVADREQSGSLSIREVPVTKNEEYIGSYQVNMLVLLSNNNHVDICPIGRFALGAIGRVDFTNYKKTFPFLYSSRKGWLSLDSRKPLTETLFNELLDQLLDN